MKYVEDELQKVITRRLIWNDSKCVLRWARAFEISLVFVLNRIKEIKCTKRSDIRYVPTEDNVADIATWESTVSKLAPDQKWWNGLTWLSKLEKCWPQELAYDEEKGLIEEPLGENQIETCNVKQQGTSLNIKKFSNSSMSKRVLTCTLRYNRLKSLEEIVIKNLKKVCAYNSPV